MKFACFIFMINRDYFYYCDKINILIFIIISNNIEIKFFLIMILIFLIMIYVLLFIIILVLFIKIILNVYLIYTLLLKFISIIKRF